MNQENRFIMVSIKQYYIRNKKFFKAVIAMTVMIIFTSLLSLITVWADFYTDHIYTFIRDPISHIVERLRFPLGEMLMYLGAILLIMAVVFLILLIFIGNKKGYTAFVSVYIKSIIILILIVLLIYSVQWLTPYRSSVLGKKSNTDREYTVEEIRTLYLYIVENINEECKNVPRDDNGNVIYDSKEVAEQKVSAVMNDISNDYTRLEGYYPTIKAAWCSDVLDWMGIGGYTYPYTMELTYNKYINRFYFPTLYAHESSHHMGYYKEHEANFLSFVSCSGSDDPVLRYSAYYYMLRYVKDEYYKNSIACDKKDEYMLDINEHQLLPQVIVDVNNANKEAQEIYLSDEHILEDYADEAAEISEVGWDTQSQILKEYDYENVVYLLLQYYDGKLY
jgi:hypothetical protein